MNEPVISASALQFSYGEKRVLRDIELNIYPGEIFGLVGADGAGKSTLLSLAVGQLNPESGNINILGKIATDPVLRDDIAYMPQGFGLYPDLSVIENLEFFADLHGLPKSQALQRIADLLQRTGLKGFEKRRGGNLSGGMMQKLALACALVHQPKVMFLDEPTTGVDPLSRRAFWRLLENVSAEGVTILYATANMDEAERCNRVAMLEQGVLLRQGTPLELSLSDKYQLLAVMGQDIRQFRHQIRQLPGVKFSFPVGLQLNVWLLANKSLDEFQMELQGISSQLKFEVQHPTLQDATLRELALAQERINHG